MSRGVKAISEQAPSRVCVFQNYLEKFYQLPKNIYRSERKNSASVVVEKLKEMQRFFGLTVTGKPNAETLAMMQKPRCGVPDTGEFMLTPGYPRWKHTDLTYRCYSRGFKTYSCILFLLSVLRYTRDKQINIAALVEFRC